VDSRIPLVPPIRLRDATNDDADAIVEIWRKGMSVSLGFGADFPEAEPYFRQCIQEQSDTSKFWVATDHAGKVLGWQSLRPTRANPIMRNLVAESSTYVDHTYETRGVGTALLQIAMQHADRSSLHYVIGYMSTNNSRMRSIVSKAGWVEVGTVPPSRKEPFAPESIFVLYTAARET